MNYIDLLDLKENPIRIKYPDCQSEIILGQFQKFMELEEEKIKLNSQLEEMKLDFQMEQISEADFKDQELMTEAEIGECYYNQLIKILPASEHPKLLQISPATYPVLVALVILKDEQITPTLSFTFPEGIEADIQRLKDDLKEERYYSLPYRRIKKQIRKLERNPDFILMPVKDLAFRVRMTTDDTRKQFPKVPTKIQKGLEKHREENPETNLKEYAKFLSGKSNSLQEQKERLKLRNLLNEYAANFDATKYKVAHEIIAHISILKGQEYNFEVHQARAESFKKLDLKTTNQILDFFLKALKLSTLIPFTERFSKATLPTK